MAKEKPVYRIGIVGSYGGLNLGDEAILQSIVAQLRRSVPTEITVFSRDAADTRQRHPVEQALQARELSRNEINPIIQGLDLLIVGGGGLLFDAEARRFLREAFIAEELGVPVFVYAIGAGPLKEAVVQAQVRDCMEATAVITVRERAARRILEDAGVRHDIHITADPALLLEPEPLPAELLRQEGLPAEGPLVGMSVREPGGAAPDIDQDAYHSLLANAADYMVDRFGASVVFVPMERGVLDMQHSHAVIARMLRPQHAQVLKGNYTPGQLLALIGRLDFAVGMRLHFLIFAALAHVPFVALPYSAKVGGFLEQMGMKSPPIHRVNAGRLLAHIDQSWDRRRSLQGQIERKLPALQEEARQTNRLLVQLLKGKELPTIAAN